MTQFPLKCVTHPDVNNLSGKPEREMQKVPKFPASKKTPL